MNWERKGLFRNASFKNTRLDCSKLLITATKGYHLQAFHDNKFRKMLNSEEAKNKIEKKKFKSPGKNLLWHEPSHVTRSRNRFVDSHVRSKISLKIIETFLFQSDLCSVCNFWRAYFFPKKCWFCRLLSKICTA